MISEKTVHIACAVDNKYAPYLGAMLASLMDHRSKDVQINIYLLYRELDKQALNKYKKILNSETTALIPKRLETKVYESFIKSFYFTEATYYRISLPEILPDLDKVIYLDSDMIIKDDICKLFEVDLGDKYLAAVQNPHFDRHKDLGMHEGSLYFNSGVMVLNTKLMRQYNKHQELLDYITNNADKILWLDQDALNAIFCDQWLILPPAWNSQTKFYQMTHKDTGYSEAAFNDALHNPSIVHFTTKSKPWHLMNNHPFKKEFLKYLGKGGWRLGIPEDFTFRNLLKRIYKKYILRSKAVDFKFA